VDASSTSSITSKGQVTIPKALRQQLGLAGGSRVSMQLVGDHIEVRPCRPEQPVSSSGSGLLKSQRPPVPVDFDAAGLEQGETVRRVNAVPSPQPPTAAGSW
jgi:AbrB family looped-hinge helix DNA binding protein